MSIASSVIRSGRLVTWKSSGVRRELQLDADAGITGTGLAGGGKVPVVDQWDVIGVLCLSFK